MTGYPGTGSTAGQKRGRFEPPRRRGALSAAERSLIRRVALDQPGTTASAALERQVEQLARLLRRSPAAVRKALYSEQALVIERDEVLAKMLELSEPLELIRMLLSQSIEHAKA